MGRCARRRLRDQIPYLSRGEGLLCDVSVRFRALIRISPFCFFGFRLINCFIGIPCADSPLWIRSDWKKRGGPAGKLGYLCFLVVSWVGRGLDDLTILLSK